MLSTYNLLQFLSINLCDGKWTSPGGDAKLYENDDISIRWYANAQTITVSGENKDEIEEKLNSVASISMKLTKISNNTEGLDELSHLEADKNLACVTDDPLETFKKSLNCKLQALTKEFTANMSAVNNTLLEHSNELKQLKNQDSESDLNELICNFNRINDKVEVISHEIYNIKTSNNQLDQTDMINNFKREIDELKQENTNLRDRNATLSYVMSDLQTKVKDTENEKNSLITAIKLLQLDSTHPSENQVNTWQTVQRKNSNVGKPSSNVTHETSNMKVTANVNAPINVFPLGGEGGQPQGI